MSGQVEAMFSTGRGSAPMEARDDIEIVPGGIAGDRFLNGTSVWSGIDECQVTLIEGEGLDEIMATTSIDVSEGQHRRNIVTRGIRLEELAGRQFRVGEAVLAYDRPRYPCRYIQQLTGQRGMTKALGRGSRGNRGGICARVVVPGTIRVGDGVEVLDMARSEGHDMARSEGHDDPAALRT